MGRGKKRGRGKDGGGCEKRRRMGRNMYKRRQTKIKDGGAILKILFRYIYLL